MGLWQESRDGFLLLQHHLGGEDGASQERTFGEACCSTPVKRTWWCLASILSLLLKFHLRGVVAVLLEILFHMFSEITLTSEVSLLFF